MATTNNNINKPRPSSSLEQQQQAKVCSRKKELISANSDLSSTNNDSSIENKQQQIKKLPPIKAPVGLAKGPDLKNCKSKIGSLNNIKHSPQSSGITIQSQKLKWNAKSKIGSLDNKEHKPGGGTLKVETRKLEWKTTSKVQSLENVHHKPGGGNVKIFNEAYIDRKPSKKARDSNNLGEEINNNETNSNLVVDNLKNLNLKD